MSTRTLYVLYNADASIMGKLTYGYRKLRQSKDCEPTCAACDITHGGLSLKETEGWTKVKKDLEASSDLRIIQYHRDEIPSALKAFLQEKGLQFPAVILESEKGHFQDVMTSADLAQCKGDPTQFQTALVQKGVIGQKAAGANPSL